MTNTEFVNQWVFDTVEKQYAEDIALVLAHSTLRLEPEQEAVSYFVPITQRGSNFAQTFILGEEGEGFDIWGIPWERLEKFADLEEYNVTVLADAKILWARSEEDRRRFEALQEKQKALLADPEKQKFMAQVSLSIAKQFYLKMQFEPNRAKVWAGCLLDHLARAIAFANGAYFKKSQTEQLAELAAMEKVPDNFGEKYQQIIVERNAEKLDALCKELYLLVGAFLESGMEKAQPEKNFQDLADWYGELAYTWLRIRTYAAQGDVTKCYMWGIFLQQELDQVCGDFGLEQMELMDSFEPENLQLLAERANELEREMRQIIQKNGGIIREYTRENFPYEV